VEASHRSAQVHNTPGRMSARPVKYR
jgi:hypothetical protein